MVASIIFPALIPTGVSGYTIENAVWFDGSSDYLERTPSSASNRDTWSFSCWVKRSTFTQQQIFTAGASSANRFGIGFASSDNDSTLSIFDDISSSTSLDVKSAGSYRDPTAWMHVLFVRDSTQGTAANRAKLYVNGVQQSYSGSPSYQGSGVDGSVNNNVAHRIGRLSYSANHPFAGYLAEVILAEVALSPTDVGEFDSNQVWVPVDPSGLTFGTNGFYLDFKVAPGTGNGAGTDVSGNGNHFTDNSMTAAQQVTDTCTDDADNNIGNYSTLNPIYNVSGFVSADLSNGNLTANSTNTGSGNARHAVATIPIPSSGKWAAKMTYNYGTWLAFGVGQHGTYPGTPSGPFQDSTFDGLYQDASDIEIYDSGSSVSSGHTKLSAGGYAEILVDVDANTIKVYTNGSQIGSTITNISADNPVFVIFLEWSNVTLDFGQNGYTPTDTSYKTLHTANLTSGYTGALADAIVTTNATEANIKSTTESAHSFSNWISILYNRDASEQRIFYASDDSSNYIPFCDDGVLGKNSFPTLSGSNNWTGCAIATGASTGIATGTISHTNGGGDSTGAHGLTSPTSRFSILISSEATSSHDGWFWFHPAMTASNNMRLAQGGSEGQQSSKFYADVTSSNAIVKSAAPTGTYRYIVFAENDLVALYSYKNVSGTDSAYVHTNNKPEWMLWGDMSGGYGQYMAWFGTHNPYNPWTKSTRIHNISTNEITEDGADTLGTGFKVRGSLNLGAWHQTDGQTTCGISIGTPFPLNNRAK
tara:strand:+ start:27313 stop:29592 length:2280 start_codon:yes stop_codon:yes gene_type:complete